MSYQENTEINELSNDLISFGLNPKDWRLVQESEMLYRIESDDDKDFIFLGSATKKEKSKRWEKIEIISL